MAREEKTALTDIQHLTCQEKHPTCQKKKAALSAVPVIVRLHNDYFATWKGEGQSRPNWEKLLGECYYILAAQYLQDAEYPYSVEEGYEERIVGMIERNGLVRFDGVR